MTSLPDGYHSCYSSTVLYKNFNISYPNFVYDKYLLSGTYIDDPNQFSSHMFKVKVKLLIFIVRSMSLDPSVR